MADVIEIGAEVRERELRLTSIPMMPSGSRNHLRIRITFDAEWEGTTKTLVAYRDLSHPYHVPLGMDGTALIPHEVLAEQGVVYLGVFGIAGDQRITSTIVRYGVNEGALTEGLQPSDPTPEMWEQLISAVNEVKQAAESAMRDAQTAAQGARRSEQAAAGSATQADGAATRAETAADTATTLARDAETAKTDAQTAQRSAAQSAADAKTAATRAEQAAGNMSTAVTQAQDAARAAQQSATQAQDHAKSAGDSAASAAQAQQGATDAETTARQSAAQAQKSQETATQAATEAGESARQAAGAQTAAQNSAQSAGQQANAAATSAQQAQQSQIAAEESATSAQASAAEATKQASASEASAVRAEKSAEDAKTAAENAATMIDDSAVKSDKTWSSRNIVDMLCPPINETGNPVVCTPVAGYPLSITASWEPTQEGTGDPSPENIRPITGRENVTVERCGINILNDVDFRNYGNWKTEYPGTTDGNKGVIIAAVPGTYTVNVEPESDTKFPVYLYLITANENAEIDRAYITTDKILEKQHTKTISHGEYLYIRMEQTLTEEQFKNQVNAIKNIGVYINTYAPASYTPYIGQTNTITLPKTVYGGEVNVVTGDSVETWKALDLAEADISLYGINQYGISNFLILAKNNNIQTTEDTENFFTTSLPKVTTLASEAKEIGIIKPNASTFYIRIKESDARDVKQAKAYLQSIRAKIVYKLATPLPITASGDTEIPALNGINTILTDADSVTVTGRADPTAYYGKKIAEINAAIVAR